MKKQDEQISRRRFLNQLSSSLLGVSIAPALLNNNYSFGASSKGLPSLLYGGLARSVIFLNMRGGMSHIDTFDLKPDAPLEYKGPLEASKTTLDDVFLSQHFKQLPKLMHKGCIIRSMTSTQGAHMQGQYLLRTSYENRGTIQHPCFSSFVSYLSDKLNDEIPMNAIINRSNNQTLSGYLESKYAPISIGNPEKGIPYTHGKKSLSQNAFNEQVNILNQLNNNFFKKYNTKSTRGYKEMYTDALNLMKSEDLSAFDITKESESAKAFYGEHAFLKGCLLARRLIEHKLRFVEVNLGGWDTHDDNFNRIEEQIDILDKGLSALILDLESRGLLNNVLVVVATEFGRTPKIVSVRNGRNHFPKAFSAVMFGGGLKGGMVYGKTNETASEVLENPVKIEDLNATMAYALGIPIEKIIQSPSGRPFKIANKGKPLYSLFV